MDWEIRKPSRECASCNAQFDENAEVHSALFDKTTEFERVDYCANCWQQLERDGIFSYWKTCIPPREGPTRQVVDHEVVMNFFRRLADATEPVKRNFRYVLALLLMRKKHLKFRDVVREDGGEFLVLYDPAEGQERRVYNPQLTEEEIQGVTEEMGKVLNIQLERHAENV